MTIKNVKSIGNGYIEATCKKCGEVFIFSQGDDIFAEIDENQDTWPLCSKCYDGPRADPSQLRKPKK
jgi:hypothetical protein